MPRRCLPFPSNSPGAARIVVALGWLALGAILGTDPAHAQTPRPWVPPSADSLFKAAADARSRFQANRGDSIAGTNYRAYEIVGQLGRRLLRSLGTPSGHRAHEVEATLDSLGLDTDLIDDPSQSGFSMLIVRNPFKPAAGAVGFMYWMRGADMRIQGVALRSGRNASMRVWWTARKQNPYSWAIVEHDPFHGEAIQLLFFRLLPDGYVWDLLQYGGNGPDLGGPGETQWADLNRDHRPELVVWSPAHLDSAFESCSDCPKLLNERVYVERSTGFEPHDSRLVPSPFSTFVLFVRLLREQNAAAARRLLATPAMLEEAIARGWARPGDHRWKLEYTEEGEAWPHWLAMRFEGAKGPERYIVHFTMKDARWIIREWIPVQDGAQPGSGAIAPGKPGATPTPRRPGATGTPRGR